VKEADVLAAKMDLLLQRMDGQVANPNMGTVQAVNSHTSCEVCGDDGHSGNNWKQHLSTMGFGHHSKVTTGGTISATRRVISSISLP